MGLADYLEERGHKVFGPRKESAILEGSKAFSKDFMKKHNIPTAKYEEVTDYESAVKALDAFDLPVEGYLEERGTFKVFGPRKECVWDLLTI